MAKFTPALLVLLILTNMCCCGNSRAAQLSHEVQGENGAYREMVDNIFKALDNNDKEGLKQLFSVNTIKNTPDLDDQIDALFRFYQGPRESYEKHYLVHSESHNEYGTKSIFLDSYFDLTAGGQNYHIYMSMDWRDDFIPDDVGIHIFDIATEEAASGKYFVEHVESWDYPPGIYIQTSPEKRDDVAWIEGRPIPYQFYARELTEEVLVDYLQNISDSYPQFTSHFGEPNASNTVYDDYYYDLNNDNYAVMGIDKDQIKYMYVANENERLYAIWLADDMINAYYYFLLYTPIERELSEEFFFDFASRSKSYSQLINEIGESNAEEWSNDFFIISNDRFVVVEHYDDEIRSIFVVDTMKKLYTILDEAGKLGDIEDIYESY